MNAIDWMPECHLKDGPDPFRVWHGRRFLARYGGRGHIVTPGRESWPSSETLSPVLGRSWYCRTWEKFSVRTKPTNATVEIPVPQGVSDPGLTLLDRVLQKLSLQRLIVTRPEGLSLDRAEHSILTLLESVTDNLWLDTTSFGWDGVTYLLAKYSVLRAAGASADKLVRLSEILNRPLNLVDFSGLAPLPVPPPPRFPIWPDGSSEANSLPPGWRSR